MYREECEASGLLCICWGRTSSCSDLRPFISTLWAN